MVAVRATCRTWYAEVVGFGTALLCLKLATTTHQWVTQRDKRHSISFIMIPQQQVLLDPAIATLVEPE